MFWYVLSIVFLLWLVYVYTTFPRYPQSMPLRERFVFYISEIVTVPTFWKLALDKIGLISLPHLCRFFASSPPIRLLLPHGRPENRTLAGVSVTIFRPPANNRDAAGHRPRGVVYFHGGGWYLGSISSHGAVAAQIAVKAKAVVVFVNYRLSPEHLFPAAVDDCFDVTEAVVQQADELGIDPNRISTLGDSSGGGLVVSVALRRRAERLRQLRAQILVFPILQCVYFGFSSYSSDRTVLITKRMVTMAASLYVAGDLRLLEPLANGRVLSRRTAEELLNRRWELGLSDDQLARHSLDAPPSEFESALLDPSLSPLAAKSMHGFSPTLVITSSLDVLQSEAELLVKRIRKAGGHVEEKSYEAPHSFFNYVGPYVGVDAAADAVDEIAGFLERNS